MKWNWTIVTSVVLGFVAIYFSALLYNQKVEERGVVVDELPNGTYEILAQRCANSDHTFSYVSEVEIPKNAKLDVRRIKSLMLFQGENISRILMVRNNKLEFLVGNDSCLIIDTFDIVKNNFGELVYKPLGHTRMQPFGCKMKYNLKGVLHESGLSDLTDDITYKILEPVANQVFFDGVLFKIINKKESDFSGFGCSKIDKWQVNLKKVY